MRPLEDERRWLCWHLDGRTLLNDLLRLNDGRPIDRNTPRPTGASVIIAPPARAPLRAAATVQHTYPDPAPAAVVNIRVELLREQPSQVIDAKPDPKPARALLSDATQQPAAAGTFESQTYSRALAAYNVQRSLSDPAGVPEPRPRLDVRA